MRWYYYYLLRCTPLPLMPLADVALRYLRFIDTWYWYWYWCHLLLLMMPAWCRCAAAAYAIRYARPLIFTLSAAPCCHAFAAIIIYAMLIVSYCQPHRASSRRCRLRHWLMIAARHSPSRQLHGATIGFLRPEPSRDFFASAIAAALLPRQQLRLIRHLITFIATHTDIARFDADCFASTFLLPMPGHIVFSYYYAILMLILPLEFIRLHCHYFHYAIDCHAMMPPPLRWCHAYFNIADWCHYLRWYFASCLFSALRPDAAISAAAFHAWFRRYFSLLFFRLLPLFATLFLPSRQIFSPFLYWCFMPVYARAIAAIIVLYWYYNIGHYCRFLAVLLARLAGWAVASAGWFSHNSWLAGHCIVTLPMLFILLAIIFALLLLMLIFHWADFLPYFINNSLSFTFSLSRLLASSDFSLPFAIHQPPSPLRHCLSLLITPSLMLSLSSPLLRRLIDAISWFLMIASRCFIFTMMILIYVIIVYWACCLRFDAAWCRRRCRFLCCFRWYFAARRHYYVSFIISFSFALPLIIAHALIALCWYWRHYWLKAAYADFSLTLAFAAILILMPLFTIDNIIAIIFSLTLLIMPLYYYYWYFIIAWLYADIDAIDYCLLFIDYWLFIDAIAAYYAVDIIFIIHCFCHCCLHYCH